MGGGGNVLMTAFRNFSDAKYWYNSGKIFFVDWWTVLH